jgi:asparagine synthase (glutamine-hydrolysing)
LSVHFGTLRFDGRPLDPELIEQTYSLISPYAPDGCNSFVSQDVAVLYCPFHTTKESRDEIQPWVSAQGVVVAFDGIIDNRTELTSQLAECQTNGVTDVAIVAAAYERWGFECFSKLLGDWAIAIWDPGKRAVLLANDFAGTRHLYYEIKEGGVRWCTLLDPLVLLANQSLALDEEYIAGCLVGYPGAQLTPYVGIHSVPPSCCVRIMPDRTTTSKYWDFAPGKRVFHRRDREYEEHFRVIFADSVRRRLRSDSPILSELSGGMDSSSIVCMADRLIARREACTPRLDTVSYHDNSEPHWNELPYFAKVEEMRGRAGYHIDLADQESANGPIEQDFFPVTPGSSIRPSHTAQKYFDFINSQGYRVLLTGIGGDEILGGVPNPVPELAELLVCFQLRRLGRQLKAWSLAKKRPWIHLLCETIGTFVPASLGRAPKQLRAAPWIRPEFIKRYPSVFSALDPPFHLCGPRPSFRANLYTIASLRNELASKSRNRYALIERRYPFLDRELVEFVCAIPREQLVRPGQRRSLMRRALEGIVPAEILERRRKAFAVRRPMRTIANESLTINKGTSQMVLALRGMINQSKLEETLEAVRCGQQAPLPLLARSLGMELWLRALGAKGLSNLDGNPQATLRRWHHNRTDLMRRRTPVPDLS